MHLRFNRANFTAVKQNNIISLHLNTWVLEWTRYKVSLSSPTQQKPLWLWVVEWYWVGQTQNVSYEMSRFYKLRHLSEMLYFTDTVFHLQWLKVSTVTVNVHTTTLLFLVCHPQCYCNEYVYCDSLFYRQQWKVQNGVCLNSSCRHIRSHWTWISLNIPHKYIVHWWKNKKAGPCQLSHFVIIRFGNSGALWH